MRSRIWMLIGVILVLFAAVSTAIYLSEQSNPNVNITSTKINQQTHSSEQIHLVSIIVKTDGSDVSVKATPTHILPKKMLAQLKYRAFNDVQSPTSTVNSLKADMKAIAKKYNYTAEVTINSQFGTDQLPFPATVSGTSMVPTLQDGQDIIVLKTKNIKVGDIVVARHPTYGLIVKRVAAIKGSKVYLKSDNRKIETQNTQQDLGNGTYEIITVEKTPLDTWLSKKRIIGVAKNY
ncbi:MAG: S24/S26 family peptidase [Methanobacteriaceae archaeon]